MHMIMCTQSGGVAPGRPIVTSSVWSPLGPMVRPAANIRPQHIETVEEHRSETATTPTHHGYLNTESVFNHNIYCDCVLNC